MKEWCRGGGPRGPEGGMVRRRALGVPGENDDNEGLRLPGPGVPLRIDICVSQAPLLGIGEGSSTSGTNEGGVSGAQSLVITGEICWEDTKGGDDDDKDKDDVEGHRDAIHHPVLYP